MVEIEKFREAEGEKGAYGRETGADGCDADLDHGPDGGEHVVPGLVDGVAKGDDVAEAD